MLKVFLQRNLRKTLLRGHPWVFREALRECPTVPSAQLCQVFDAKKTWVGWAMYDPNSPLCLRMLSTEKTEPSWHFWQQRFTQAWELREILRQHDTTGYRLFHGEGDRLPGLVCDLYDRTAVLQFDGPGPYSFWHHQELFQWLRHHTGVHTILDKSRMHQAPQIIEAPAEISPILIRELGVLFQVDVYKGQKTGLFFDQRDNRQYVREISRGLRVLNLFSYTGGFSVFAGCGDACDVTSVDISRGAVESAHQNWLLNGLKPDCHHSVCADVFAFLQQPHTPWDLVIVDPPSMAHAEDQKARAMTKYIETFALAARCVKPQGHLLLSSCSSHISFPEFMTILQEAISRSHRTGQILRISGQGLDHPFPHVCEELRYLKFVHCRLHD